MPKKSSTRKALGAMAVPTSEAVPIAFPADLKVTLEPLDEDFVVQQRALGAQSCRGVASPDLSPLGGDTHAVKLFKRMFAKETDMAGEWACFYHSYNTPALIYEVQAAVAKVLFKFGAKHGVLPRLQKRPFEKIPDAAAMLKAFPTWPDQDHNHAFKSVGICCSTSLVSHDPEATPTQVFLHGYGVSTVGVEIVEKLLVDCGTPKAHVKRLAQAVVDIAKKYGLPQAIGSPSGHLLQIFIHRSCVDKWAYASLPMGVPDKSRHPLSKALASNKLICGQARLTVNPSAFMRARAVRLYAYSADAVFHRSRREFQEALFSVLAPILGSPEVREAAAKGIYGGHLPVWWRDLESEKDNEEREDCAEEARAVQRARCRYGEACDQHAPDHRWKFAHLGDADWDAAEANQASNETSAATEGNAPTQCRPRCRYGADCYRKGAEHRSAFAHLGDTDWDAPEAKPALEEAATHGDVKASRQSRPRCRYGSDCYRNGADHRRAFAHPGDADWNNDMAREGDHQELEGSMTAERSWNASSATSSQCVPCLSPQRLMDFKSDFNMLAKEVGRCQVIISDGGSGRVEAQHVASNVGALERANVELTESWLLERFVAPANSESECAAKDTPGSYDRRDALLSAGAAAEIRNERFDLGDGQCAAWESSVDAGDSWDAPPLAGESRAGECFHLEDGSRVDCNSEDLSTTWYTMRPARIAHTDLPSIDMVMSPRPERAGA